MAKSKSKRAPSKRKPKTSATESQTQQLDLFDMMSEAPKVKRAKPKANAKTAPKKAKAAPKEKSKPPTKKKAAAPSARTKKKAAAKTKKKAAPAIVPEPVEEVEPVVVEVEPTPDEPEKDAASADETVSDTATEDGDLDLLFPEENDGGTSDGDGDGDGPGGDGDVVHDDEGPSSLRRMMAGNFIEYASYVIKERAIPHLDDGLKPVQRRILHTLREMDDGKLHKVANVVGSTMKYHPHGDSSIYSALVNVANKDFFIERQGNFGNIYTGDPASAARYIECRLSEMAREVLFQKDLTEFIDSYDGRNQEPVTLPARVPVLLMQGSEGIAVGMSTRILSHNFVELLEAQIKILRKQGYEIYPDFIHGGIMDVSEYDKGKGKIRLRAKIEIPNEKSVIIREIPASTTTESLIRSIEEAANKGKLRISSISDFTAEDVEIEIKLPRGIYADDIIKALYAYTDCEVSISCNCLVIHHEQPRLMDVHEMLEHNTFKLRDDLGRELEINLGRIIEQYFFKSLVQIFIENRIYKKIEKCTSYESVRKAVYKGLEPFVDGLICPAAAKLAELKEEPLIMREVNDEDIEKLLQIPIRRISQFDIDRNQEELDALITKAEEMLRNLKGLTKYTIRYIRELIKKYGKNYPRRTIVEEIEQVDIREIAQKNLKVGLDRKNGFVGTAIKTDDPIACTEFDRLVILKWDGTFRVVQVPEKLYVGSICAVFKANRDQVYSMVYRERKSRICFAKRFQVSSYIMGREYKAVPKGCKVEKIFDRYGVILRCEFRPKPRQREKFIELNFDEVEMRKATARGFKIHNYDVAKFIQIRRGTISPDGYDEPGEDDES